MSPLGFWSKWASKCEFPWAFAEAAVRVIHSAGSENVFLPAFNGALSENSHAALPYTSLCIYSYCFPFPRSSRLHPPTARWRKMYFRKWPEVMFPEVVFAQRSLSCSISFTTSHICTDNTCGRGESTFRHPESEYASITSQVLKGRDW